MGRKLSIQAWACKRSQSNMMIIKDNFKMMLENECSCMLSEMLFKMDLLLTLIVVEMVG